MNILITGASGFIGQNLVDYFVKEGIHNIITLDLKPATHNTNHYCLDISNFSNLSNMYFFYLTSLSKLCTFSLD